MGEKTIYGVEPYWYDGRRLARGIGALFYTRREAERAAERLYRNHAGVIVFRVRGRPEFDCWEDPQPVARIGRVPG